MRRQDDEDMPKGTMARSACSILMKLLFSARLVRFDLLRAVQSLAARVTTWTIHCDQWLHRLMCYIHHSYDLLMSGCVGNKVGDMTIELAADADVAGEEKARSTSGVFMCLHGSHILFPLAAASKKQTSTAWSTPEAETVAAAYALRMVGIPSMDLWKLLNGTADLPMKFLEENSGAYGIMKTGKGKKATVPGTHAGR